LHVPVTHTTPHPHLEAGLGSIALYILPIDDNLDDTIPHLLTDVIPGQTNEVQDRVHIPRVVLCILFCQDSNLQHLWGRGWGEGGEEREERMRGDRGRGWGKGGEERKRADRGRE